MKSIEELLDEPWRKKIKWDITHAQAEEMVAAGEFYFDPTLSYETSGYRPLTETQGLDFDPTPFTEVGKYQIANKKYHDFVPGSKKHVDWWKLEYEKCEDGYQTNGYRLTGDNYFFLNFYSMLVVKKGQKAGSGRQFIHPDFWAAHYEWFHYIELCEMLGFDALALKARGVGFSEIGACLGVRPYTTTPYYNAVYVASYEPFLKGKGIVQKCWSQLDWLNQNTDGGMKRLRILNQDLHKKAGKADKQGNESGHMAQISGQVVDKADKLRGDRTERLVFEESGSNPALLATYGVSEPLVIINGERVGTRIVFGTGGDVDETVNPNSKSKSGLHGLETMFLKPKAYKILPFKHNYNQTGIYVLTGFFLPAWKTVRKAMDHRGVTIEAKGRAYYDNERKLLQSEPEAFLKHCAEYCYTYEEALSRKGSNRFDQVKLAAQRVEIDIHKSTPETRKGFLSWTYETGTNRVNGVKFTQHHAGTVELYEEPVLEDNKPVRNLYVAGIDSIDTGANESIIGKEGSKFCMMVKKRSYGLQGNQYVCKYLERPDDIRKAYETAAMILTWYGCKANLEATRVALIVYFREKGWINMLMDRPKYAIEGQSRSTAGSNMIGTQSSEKMIDYGLELVKDYINDYCHNIYFSDMCHQLQEYSYELKGKYDIVAALQMTEIGDQELMGIHPRKEVEEVWEDIGYYRDSDGRYKYGVINKQNEFTIQFPS